MIPRGCGKIVNIGSLMSAFARPTVAPYTAAKGGAQAVDPVDGGRVGRVRHPGPCHRSGLHADRHERGADQQSAIRRLGEGTYTTRGAGGRRRSWSGRPFFLASSASDYVNGQIIYVDGGMSAVL